MLPLPDELNKFYARFEAANTAPVMPTPVGSEHNTLSVSTADVRRIFKQVNIRKAADKRFGMGTQVLTNFYTCTIESILTYSLTSWFGSSTTQDQKVLQRVVKTAQNITGSKLTSIQDIFHKRSIKKTCNIIRGSSHPAHTIFRLLPSGKRVCNMVEKDMMPISTVDGEGFRELINFLEPGYRIPSRETYITVTCHYIEQDWQVKSTVLLTESMFVRNTADNLAEKPNEAVESWGLTGRVIDCVHDNARNIVSANNPTRVSWHSVPCVVHTLQLAVNVELAAYLNRVTAAAGRLEKHFNHSTPATKVLEAKQQQMQLPPHRFIQSCKTRWNSVCDMFGRLVEPHSDQTSRC
ncbi:hypothetical protein SKAU_G00280130 [Synaphobranchus kaupii]|uniref:Uncharacterized protein n=1 Tax=Synaphobranchus kaupii TaxID=118154 RepID=A0A9Q1ILR9_SYNKA|nr:hypothetical protein SKAU_G00280130 [Synaphobranchus kaupii]